MKYLVIRTTPPLRGLLGTIEPKTTLTEVEADSPERAADAVDAPHVGTKLDVVPLDDVYRFERTSTLREAAR